MRDTPDRQLQLDFQRRAPETCTDCSDLAARASSAFHDARLTSTTGSRLEYRRFLPIRTEAPAVSDVPFPLPRRRVNDDRIQCELGTPSFDERRRITAAGFHHAPAWPARPRRQPQPTACPNEHDKHSPTSAIDAKPEHTGERSLPGATPLFTTKRCASRRSGDARPHRPFRPGVSAVLGTEAGSST